MYNNLIYFMVVLLVFILYQPAEKLPLPWWASLGLCLCLLAVFQSLARTWFRRLRRDLETQSPGSGGQAYSRLSTRLSVLAVVLFTLEVFFLGLKDLITALPLVGRSTALTGLAGLLVFALFLSVLWAEAYYAYTRTFRSRLSRPGFVSSQLRFNLPIILPWLLLSAAADLIALIPQPGLKAWLDSPAGGIVFFLTFLGAIVVLFPVLVRPLWGLVPLPSGPQREAIEAFCRQRGFAFREIMLWPLYEGEAMTAGVMGLVRRWRFLLITRSLLKVLDEEELAAVLAHELGHVKHRHLLFYLFLFVGFLVTAYLVFNLSLYLFMSSDRGVDLLLSAKGNRKTSLGLFLNAPMILLMIVYFRFIFGAFMRNFERQADLFAYGLTRGIKGLVGSLEKIAYYSGQSRQVPSWHHFSVAQRVDFLFECRREPSLIRRHAKKVRIMIAAYCLGLALAGGAWFKLHEMSRGEDINLRFAARVLEAEIKRDPAKAEAHLLLGDVYYRMGRARPAIEAYERAAALDPDNPEALNNLAWTLVTGKGASEKEKVRGLKLARRAAALKRAPYILDTLAEALFVNGKRIEALETIDQALELAGPTDDKDYLRAQKTRFEKAGPKAP